MQAALAWFDASHELVVDGGVPRYRPLGMLAEGAIADQDAYLWDALQVIRQTLDQRIQETLKARQPSAKDPAARRRR